MDSDSLKKVVSSLVYDIETLSKEIKVKTDTLRHLQSICEHDWKINGHDSHKDHYLCSICEKEDIW